MYATAALTVVLRDRFLLCRKIIKRGSRSTTQKKRKTVKQEKVSVWFGPGWVHNALVLMWQGGQRVVEMLPYTRVIANT